jgi:transposase
LFAILVLKYFLKTDFRGVVAFLADWPDLRRALGLKNVPHYSTLCYAQERLLEDGKFQRLLAAVWEFARQQRLIDTRPEVAIDATGLESRHVSAHYVDRKGYRRFKRKKWPKLTAVAHTATHLIAGVVVSQGPSQDSPQFPDAIKQAATHLHPDRVLGDKGYDGEHNHRLCREELGIRSTIIPINKRNRGRKWPKSKYRRQMRRRFFKRKYGQRWQVESVFSRHKRRLGSALTARSEATQRNEMLFRVLTHNLMILRRTRSRFSTEHADL